jgi:hypothetical protein
MTEFSIAGVAVPQGSLAKMECDRGALNDMRDSVMLGKNSAHS